MFYEVVEDFVDHLYFDAIAFLFLRLLYTHKEEL